MKYTSIQICLTIFIIPTVLVASGLQNARMRQDSLSISRPIVKETKPYYLIALYGKNNLMLNERSKNTNIAILYSPYENISGPGIGVGRLKGIDQYKDSFYYVQPFISLPYRFLSLKLGLNLMHIFEGEGPSFLYLPAFEIKIGKMDKLYFSVGLLSELFFGIATLNISYFYKNKISGFMIGRTYGDENEYSGYIYKIDQVIFKKIFLRIWGNANFAQKMYGTQFGIGLLFD
jgi:hypothetical protein